MSDIFDHEADAYGEMLHGLNDEPSAYPHPKYKINRQYGPQGNRMRQRPNNPPTVADLVELKHLTPTPGPWSFPMEEAQPEYQQFHVEGMHSETQKSWLVSGTVHFDPEYYGYRKFHFEKIWLPKSRCEATGNCIRVPQWLIKNRFRDKTHKKDHRPQFGSLIDKADALIGKTVTVDFKTIDAQFGDGYPRFVGMRRPFYDPPF